jgi:hypothetical protein
MSPSAGYGQISDMGSVEHCAWTAECDHSPMTTNQVKQASLRAVRSSFISTFADDYPARAPPLECGMWPDLEWHAKHDTRRNDRPGRPVTNTMRLPRKVFAAG